MPASWLRSLLNGDARRTVGRQRRRRVRLQLKIQRPRRRLDPHECRRHRHLGDAAGTVGRRHPGQERHLVLPPHHAPDVQAPDLCTGPWVAQRLERNPHLDGVSDVGADRLDVPHGVPVDVQPAGGNGLIAKGAYRIGLEKEPVTLVQKGVQRDSERVVERKDILVVAAQLVGDNALRLAVVAARRYVQIVVVKKHPEIGGLSGGHGLARQLLDEAVDRTHGRVDLLVPAGRQGEAAG